MIGSKKLANDVVELRAGVADCWAANENFKHYLSNDWVFDNANLGRLEDFLLQSSDKTEIAQFPVNVKNIEWTPYAWNHAYGVKHYVLKEEAVVPAEGYNDLLMRLRRMTLKELAFGSSNTAWFYDARPPADMERTVLETNSVREVIGEIVAEKLAYYKHTLKLDVDENAIYQEVRKEATNSLRVIMATYSSYALRSVYQSLSTIFQRIYDKIIINGNQMKKLRELAASRRGPVIFCPTHRSYVDFLICSIVLAVNAIAPPHICAGEDLMHIKGVSTFLRMCGAFFMRRTFRGDPMYKAIFTEYVK